MKHRNTVIALLLVVVVPTVALAAAARPAGTQRVTVGKVVIVTPSLVGSLQGPWTASKGVTITADGTTLTADTVKIWIQKGGQRVERIEASGNVRVTGTYTMAQAGSPPADWKVNASSQEATYDGETQTAVMSGKVDLQATNTSTGEVITARAGKATYTGKTQQFTFEQQVGEPVQVQWQEPPTKAAGQ